jgi:Ser/Thr protein kinase RdoA (MazF antagonist)
VCHNDVCIENVVFDDRREAVGLLDFDFAAPGRAVRDLVHTARY